MKHPIRVCMALAFACAQAAHAQNYPAKPVRIVVPFAAGSGADVSARQVAQKLTGLLEQPVLVENRPGASGIIGTDAVAKAAPDGYTTVWAASGTMAMLPYLSSKLPFNAERDFAPISLINIAYAGLQVHADLPAADVKQLVALSKTRKLNAGTIVIGINSYLFGLSFEQASGADLNFIHSSTTQPSVDLLAGRLDLIFDGLAGNASAIRAGKVKVLAVAGKTRRPAFPGIPTFAEAGLPDYEPLAWGGLFAPAGTPQANLQRLGGAAARAARSPELVQAWERVGSEAVGSSPEEFVAFVKSEQAKWSRIIRTAGVRLD
ncbi:MAG: tripartite tricarboxylate transporter substrate binding protein [Burkholderiales bacterium]|nr:tripartite tricarboxylate transporter substrate binding protein [Burkholderiales bacterium]